MHLVVEPYEVSSEAGEGFMRIDLGIGAGKCTDTCGGSVSLRGSTTAFTGGRCWCGGETNSEPADDGRVCRYCAVRGSLLEMDAVGTEGIKTGEKSADGNFESKSSALGDAGDSMISESSAGESSASSFI